MRSILHVCFENPWKPQATGGALEMRRRIEVEAQAFEVRVFSIDFPSERAPAPPGAHVLEHRHFDRTPLPRAVGLLRYPLPVARRFHAGMARALQGLPVPDLIIVEGIQMAWVLDDPWLVKSRAAGAEVAVRVHNIESAYHAGLASGAGAVKSVLHRMVARQYRRLETDLLDRELTFEHISPSECRTWASSPGRSRHTWVPPVVAQGPASRKAQSSAPILKYFGDLSVPANRESLEEFLEHDWPQVLEADPRAQFQVAGRGSQSIHGANVSGHGFVDSLTRWLEDAACLLVPNRNPGGLKIKLLDCLATGLPVAASPEMWAEAASLGIDHPWRPGRLPPVSRQVLDLLSGAHRREFSDAAATVQRVFSPEAHLSRMKEALHHTGGTRPAGVMPIGT